MKLARKLTAAIALAILVAMVWYDYALVRQEIELFDSDVQRIVQPGKRLGEAMEAVWRAYGTAEAQRVLATMNEGAGELSLRWLWLDAPEGDPQHVSLSGEALAKIKGGEIVSFVDRDDPRDPRRYAYVPLSVPGERPAALELTESLRREHSFIQTTHRRIILTTALLLLLCTAAILGLGWWFVGRPIQRLRDKARAVGAGELSLPLVLRQRDEIGELADEINAMCERIADAQGRLAAETEARIAAIEQMRHTDRLTTMGPLASGVAHELGAPLTVIGGRAEMIASGEVQADEAQANARIILQQANVMSGLIRQLLDFSRRQAAKFNVTSLRAICTRTVDLLGSVARRRQVTLELRAADDDPMLISADDNQVQQALTNIVMNGVQSTPEGGRLTITVESRRARPPDAEGEPSDWLCVTVEDQGEGIPSENLPRIFEPFFTTKPMGEGTGLGLSVAYGIVKEHGGWIDVESVPGRGSRFSIFLPPAANAVATGHEVTS